MREKGGSKRGRLKAAGLKLWETTHLFEIQRSAIASLPAINAERS